MDNYDIAYAREHLEELIERARRGEEVTIADPKRGSVRLTAARVPDLTAPRVTDTMEPFVPSDGERPLGRLKGKMRVPARLMEPMSEEELRDWYGDDA